MFLAAFLDFVHYPEVLTKTMKQFSSYQVVVRPDAKQFSEVAEGHRSICFKAEVWEMVCWGEIAAFTKVQKQYHRTNSEKTKFK